VTPSVPVRPWPAVVQRSVYIWRTHSLSTCSTACGPSGRTLPRGSDSAHIWECADTAPSPAGRKRAEWLPVRDVGTSMPKRPFR